MAGSCVQVQCTFGDFSKDFTAFTELVEHACGSNLHALAKH